MDNQSVNLSSKSDQFIGIDLDVEDIFLQIKLQEKVDKANKDKPLIEWCKQFLRPNSVFVDIGAEIGGFSTILSKVCKHVYAFESNLPVYHKFLSLIDDKITNITANYVDNYVDASQYEVDMEGRIKLMKYQHDDINIFIATTKLIIDNKFPSLIIKIDKNMDVLDYVKELGYKVQPISGCTKMYLAGDHHDHEELQEEIEEDIDILDEMCKISFPLDIPDKTIDELLDQYQKGTLITDNWEIYYRLSKHYRLKGKNKESYDCAQLALSLGIPKKEEYKIYEELSIVSFYVGKKQDGYDACDKVIFSHDAPFNLKNSTINNQSYYMNKIPFSKIITVDFKPPKDYIGTSASIVPHNEGFKMCLRTVNYSINSNGSYTMRDPCNIVRTKNFLLTLDQNLIIQNGVELIDKSDIKLYPSKIKGMEDVRLFSTNEFLCTDLEVNSSQTPQICYCKFDDNGDVTNIKPLTVTEKIQCEKNWMPFYLDEEPHFLYSVHPLKLYRLSDMKLIKEIKLSNLCLNDFRGSAGLISYKNGFVGSIHQVYHSNPRKYFHRFVWFDKDFTEIKYSKIFYFESAAIEFNLSICHSKIGLLVPYSQNDNSSKIGILPYHILDEWLGL